MVQKILALRMANYTCYETLKTIQIGSWHMHMLETRNASLHFSLRSSSEWRAAMACTTWA